MWASSCTRPAAGFLKVQTRKTIGRLKQAFPDLDRRAFGDAMQAVDRGFAAVVKQVNTMPLFQEQTNARGHALKVLPNDDSALQWSPTGTGLAADLAKTFERLYERYVSRYDHSPNKRRTDDDIWRSVRDKLMERGLDIPFQPKSVVGEQDRIAFERLGRMGGGTLMSRCRWTWLMPRASRTRPAGGAAILPLLPMGRPSRSTCTSCWAAHRTHRS